MWKEKVQTLFLYYSLRTIVIIWLGENSFFWRGSRNYYYNNIITNDDSQWERKLFWVSYQILFSPPHLLLTNSLKVWEDFFLPVFTIFRSCWLLVNCFAPALNLYLTIEASNGVLLYTLLSSSKVFTLVTWNQLW